MAVESKYVLLSSNILLEYVYDDNNLKQEDYHIVNNLNIGEKTYCPKIGLNSINNTAFPIDPIVKKYALINQEKYNYLKIGNYQTNYVHFDKIRLHFPTTYSFIDNNYIGIYLKIYAFDYVNKKTVNLTSFIYDDTKIGSDKNFIFNKEFIYNEQQYGKYLTFDIPSVYEIARQRTNTISTDLPLSNTINSNLSQYGLNLETPIFFDFSWIISRQKVLGNEYYYISDLTSKSISNKPEYQTLGVQIQESDNGDYFEIFGTYNQSNEYLDDWVDEMIQKGRKIRIEYHVSLFEENILTNQQTFLVTEYFTKKILYRPIITFSNTVASIDVEMKVIDLYDNSQIIRKATLGLKNNIFKYGRKLTKIDIDNAYKPKIYNQKVLSNSKNIKNQIIPDINLTKVNFPVIVDRIKILTKTAPSNITDYKSMGLSEIIINPFGNILKFDIASEIKDTNIAIPYDLTKITENSTITLSFKDETNFIEKDIWQETNQNNFELGIIIFKIDETDIPVLKNIAKNNKNFYLTIKNNDTDIRTLLYSGKFIFYEEIAFIDTKKTNVDTTTELNNNDNLINKDLPTVIQSTANLISQSDINKNLFVFLKNDADASVFENYLSSINADIHFKQAGGNDDCLTYMYFLLNLKPSVILDIKNRIEVMNVIEMEFCLGKGKISTSKVNIDDITSTITAFNCNAQ